MFASVVKSTKLEGKLLPLRKERVGEEGVQQFVNPAICCSFGYLLVVSSYIKQLTNRVTSWLRFS